MQIQRTKDCLLFCLKPLAGSRAVDFLGTARAKAVFAMSFTSEKSVLIQFEEQRPLHLDLQGYLIQQDDFELHEPLKVVAQSNDSLATE